jgi:hypothetical protein
MEVDESSGSSCTSGPSHPAAHTTSRIELTPLHPETRVDEDLDFSVKLEQRLAEKARHGRVLRHRERRKLRRQEERNGLTASTAEAKPTVVAVMDVDTSGTESEECASPRSQLEGAPRHAY